MTAADPADRMLRATSADLPPGVADALAHPIPAEPGSVDVAGWPWATRSWGSPADPPLLVVHGVTSDSGIWWRVAPALAASGRHVIAVDMPGHGRTSWRDRYRFPDTAADLAAFIRAASIDRPDLAVVGHSWGAMVSAHLLAAGIRPAALVLIDPPHLTLGRLEALTQQPTERPYETLADAIGAVRAANPSWSDGDVEAKARALTRFSADAVLAVLLRNGNWDAGMTALRHPAAAGIPTWLIRGEWATGGFIADSAVLRIREQLGADRVITIAGGPHSPQRTHPEATVLAILRALSWSPTSGSPNA